MAASEKMKKKTREGKRRARGKITGKELNYILEQVTKRVKNGCLFYYLSESGV